MLNKTKIFILTCFLLSVVTILLTYFELMRYENIIYLLIFLLLILVFLYPRIDFIWIYLSVFYLFLLNRGKLHLIFEIITLILLVNQFKMIFDVKNKYINFLIILILCLIVSRFLSNSYMINNYYIPIIYNFR
jgi:hypothetical protein